MKGHHSLKDLLCNVGAKKRGPKILQISLLVQCAQFGKKKAPNLRERGEEARSLSYALRTTKRLEESAKFR